ncbi:MAG TPA: damage-inducible protein CinA, partial [Alphaproteobacteria bacterium]|nr:damage-inducible protein CinA [Alphaproteobacteria bacterium]
MNPIAAMIIEQATASRVMIAAAESCTGGMVAAALTDIPGSSVVLDRGFVTYSNTAKAEMLGVDPAIISHHGAVSEEVVRAMAAGALNSIAHSGSKLAVS